MGWTETWFGFSQTNGTLDTWLKDPNVWQYIALRRPIMPSIYRCVWVRISDEANPKSFKVASVIGGVGTADTIIATTEGQSAIKALSPQVQCALLVDMARLPLAPDTKTHHRKFLLRALPAGLLQGNITNPASAYWPFVKTFLNFLANHEVAGGPGAEVALGKAANAQATNIGLRFQDPNSVAYQACGSSVPS